MTALPISQSRNSRAECGPRLVGAEADRYTRRLIRHRARRLVRQAGLKPVLCQDVEQELWVDLVARRRRFDAARASECTFAARVVEHHATKLFHKGQATRRRATHNGRSLEETIGDDSGQIISLSQAVHDGAQRFRSGHIARHAPEQRELAIDLADVLAKLPAALRDICQRLKQNTIAEVARDLNISRTSLYRRIERARAHFVAAGLHEYFGIRADTFSRAGVCN